MRTKTPSKKTLTEQANQLVDQVSPHVEAARERIVNDYLPAAQTALAEARDTAIEVAKDARQAAQEAAVSAEKSTRKSRKKAAKNAKAKASSMATAAAATPAAVAVAKKMGHEPEKPKRGKRFVLLLALVGAGAVVFKKLRGQSPAPTTYTPPARPRSVPDPVSTTPPAPPEMHFEPDGTTDAGPGTDVDGTTDAGGAFLDEVAADADEQPHPVTTPDQPADVQDVSGKKQG
jgi:hypothetical protein